MKTIGFIILIAGIIWAAFAANMTTSVPTAFGDVNNLGLMATQQHNFIGAGVAILAGVLFVGFGFMKGDAPEATDMRKCPHCAEMIKAEAKVCRYCGKDSVPVEDSLTALGITRLGQDFMVHGQRYYSADKAIEAASKPRPEELTASEERMPDCDLMLKYGIHRSGRKFVFRVHTFDTLKAAIAYVKKC